MASCDSSETENRRIGCKIIERPNKSLDKPDVVLIGPYNNNPLHPLEQEKKEMLNGLLPVDKQPKKEMLTKLLDGIARIEKEARDHYADRANRMQSKEFVEMLLLDGCYILAKFVLPHCCPGGHSVGGVDGIGSPAGRHSGEVASIQNGGASGSLLETQSTGTAASQRGSTVEGQSTGTAASQSGNPMRSLAVPNVFYLLDNQIPFCVLDTIYSVLHKQSSSSMVVANTLATHLGDLLQRLGYSRKPVRNIKPWHLLHLVYKHFELNDDNAGNSNISTNSVENAGTAGPNAAETVYRWRAATKYHEAGVKFKKQPLGVATSSARSILDVKLDTDGQTLRIPSLTVDDNTCTMLRNLMTLERINPRELGGHITAYCLFMAQLACNAPDIELLVKKGIIVHALHTDKDVAERLAALCSSVIIDLDEPTHNYLHRTRWDLERLYKNRGIKWIAMLRRNHCGNPWVLTALVVAFLGFASGIFQSVYTALTYYYRR
uniref:Uncharacterized protein n=1 Tax=Oryza punctata TaxID=4537 RepID=A0A0E0LZJ6_ORYPU